ncbi:hypothetical protein PIB30_061056, partial [Stylosanthes scabra]|nr:hypothetical protein [Stylosanthes scabra]
MVCKEGNEEYEEEEEDDWLYELLVELAKLDDMDEEENCEKEGEEKKGEKEEEAKEDDEEETFFIATVYGGNKATKEEIPAKCENPGPCLVTCKIRGTEIPDYMCDPGACRSVMHFEVYETLDLGPLRKSNEVFTMVDTIIVFV